MRNVSLFIASILILINLLIISSVSCPAQTYSWQKPHATVLPNGDLQWAPESYTFSAGASPRYIDYDGGDDSNSGTSTSSAWKHHPWDIAAGGNSVTCIGIHTYVFKRGVVYRGIISARESGTTGNPIRLTSDPAWGSGEAMYYGSQRITGGWTKADSANAPKIPNPDKVWYIDLLPSMVSTKMVAEVIGDSIVRIPLARTPNWKISDTLAPMSEWWTWTGTVGSGTAGGYRIDTVHFKQSDPAYWVGGQVWSQWNGVMGTMWGDKINSYDPATSSVKTGNNFGGKDCRYYIENLPQLLDTTNEFFFDKSGAFPGRLYIRLMGEKDPNTTSIEVASKGTLITIWSQQNIEISGLSFAFTTYDQIHYSAIDPDLMAPVICIKEKCFNIKISNCKFNYINAGITLRNAPDPAWACHDVTISDNEMNHVDDQAITCGGNSNDFLANINILRNKIFDNGGRHLCRWYSFVPAISGQFTIAEIAGNIIELSWGSGINTFWGKADGDASRTVPLIRGMVHHNRADKTLLGLNDYGGIEGWQGGPTYFFNNYSKHAQGPFKWSDNSEWSLLGYPFYFDGAFKLYCFNNISIGPGNSLTDKMKGYHTAYQHVMGFHTIDANNTAYKFLYGTSVVVPTPGYNCYLGNIFDDISKQYFNNEELPLNLIPYESYGYNIFYGTNNFGSFSSLAGYFTGLNNFKTELASRNAMLSQTGYESTTSPLTNPAGNDFRPKTDSKAIDHGVKFFAPFSLSAVVGEWHFYRCLAYTIAPGSNFYFTTEYGPRADYINQPKNHLNAIGLDHTSYVNGPLEDWTEGALRFNGSTNYCFITDVELKKKIATNLDMDKESFIIETYIRTSKAHTGGVLVSKYAAGGKGYALDIDESGRARIRILIGGSDAYFRKSTAIVNDSVWHHILVEVDRKKWLANVYVDGKLNNGTENGSMPELYESISNPGDFLVGKSPDGNFYKGDMEFLRVSKGLLTDAQTTIEELYAWEFSGPFLKDFVGNMPQGKRDAGALEAGKTTCSLSVNPAELTFGIYKGTKTLTVTPSDEFTYHSPVSWLTPTESNGVISLYITSNMTNQPRYTSVTIYGCYDTIVVPITQPLNPYVKGIKENKLSVIVYPNPAHDVLNIESEEETSLIITIMNIQGQELMSRVMQSSCESIDISSIPCGMYFVKMNNRKGEMTVKCIKE